MTTIEQIKTALQTHIAEAEAATPGPWTVEPTSSNRYSLLIRGDTEYAKWSESTQLPSIDAAFIAHARTMSPAACKCLLAAIDMLDDMPFHLADVMEQRIRLEWHNLTQKQ